MGGKIATSQLYDKTIYAKNTIFVWSFSSLFCLNCAFLILPQDQPDEEPDKLSNRVFQFDPSKDRWTECSRMKYSRYRCGTAVLNGEIYILGQTIGRAATVLFCVGRNGAR